ncbi:MAG: major capsid protein [Rhodococcus sp. (in: high G+C Gram-positive bacteria)]|nr:major capsid protein [Rhodococcus sp. (in: high G+C Gram-positive bacteria)]
MALNPSHHPLAGPEVDGTNYTVDLMLKEPTRITRYLSDLMLPKYFMHRIFSSGGSVSGGSVIYDQLTKNDLYSDRDVQNVEPGGEFPIVTSSRQAPRTAQVEKFGGKFEVLDEARDRNDPSSIKQETTEALEHDQPRNPHPRCPRTRSGDRRIQLRRLRRLDSRSGSAGRKDPRRHNGRRIVEEWHDHQGRGQDGGNRPVGELRPRRIASGEDRTRGELQLVARQPHG